MAAAATLPAEPVVLFRRGEGGVHTYRIPALIETRGGTLLAVADARHDGAGDLPARISLAMRRSDDGGRSWSAVETLRAVSEGGVGDASLLVDRRNGRVWCFHAYGPPGVGFNTGPASLQVHAITSDNDGQTWSPPRDLTAQLRDPSWRSLFATSGTHIQTRRGTYLLPLVFRDDRGAVSACTAFSDDAGLSWRRGNSFGPGTDESKCVELRDGRILQNLRNGPTRAVAISRDGGATFGPAGHDASLIDPGCNAAILRWKTRLLFSNAASGKRENLTLKQSLDEGLTWTTVRLLYAGPSAYSTMVTLRDGSVGVMYEWGEGSPYERIEFQRVHPG